MSEDVVFKGSRAGLQLFFDETIEFSSVVKQVEAKLESAMHFFGYGTTVNIAAGLITKEQEDELSSLFHRYGLTLKAIDFSVDKTLEQTNKTADEDNLPREITVINKTMRGGQELVCEGSVVIFGNVNPGARIIAGGNIEIKGTCRGLVHAGAFGDVTAVVIAEQMMAMQIRIADLIARSPDHLEKTECAEYACIKDGNIVIEPVNKQEVC